MKIKTEFELTEVQFDEIVEALGYGHKIFDPNTKEEIDNPQSPMDTFQFYLKEHMGHFIQMFAKQRIHTKLKKEEDKVNEKEVRPIVDKMTIDLGE